MKYLLDTNIVSYFSDPESPFHQNTVRRFSPLTEEDMVYIYVLTLYETQYGIVYAPAVKKQRLIEVEAMMKQSLSLLPVSPEGADIFGRIKAEYRRNDDRDQKAFDRHDIDFILASSAIAEDATLVSNDKIFFAIRDIEPSLRLENWAV